MALRTRKTVDASALAQRHANAVSRRESAIAQAEAAYAAERQTVIEIGTQRVAEISVLQAELAKEKAAISEALVGVQS